MKGHILFCIIHLGAIVGFSFMSLVVTVPLHAVYLIEQNLGE